MVPPPARPFDPSPLQLTPGCYRIPDGDVVPNPPRPAPEAEATPTRYQRLVLWLVLTVVALAITIRSLR